MPSYSPVKATCFPSGEKRGEVSEPSWEVRRRAEPPASGAIQTADRLRGRLAEEGLEVRIGIHVGEELSIPIGAVAQGPPEGSRGELSRLEGVG